MVLVFADANSEDGYDDGSMVVVIMMLVYYWATELEKKQEGTSPQIYTVSHVWTFEFQFFSSFGYPTFQHKSQ